MFVTLIERSRVSKLALVDNLRMRKIALTRQCDALLDFLLVARRRLKLSDQRLALEFLILQRNGVCLLEGL